MKEILIITRKDLQLLLLDKTSLTVTFALPLVLIALIGAVFSKSFPAVGISSYDYAFSKVMFWGLIGGAASSVASMANEKNSGTIVRLQLSPIRKVQLIVAKCFACIFMLLVSSVLSWLLATLAFDIKTKSFLLLVLVLICNAVLFAGIMIFLSNFVKTERAAGALSWSVLQVLACFSGIMFPLTIVPSWMVTITNFNPVTWAVKAMGIALWKDGTFSEMLLPVAIPVLAGLFFAGIAVYLFRWNTSN